MTNEIYPVRDSESWRGQRTERASNGVNLSVIVPAYNEEKRLPKTLQEIDKYLRGRDYNYEIIVVNGGSTDRTSDIVRQMMPEIKNLKLLEVKNLGKGYAVREGMLRAKGKYRVFTDADNSTSIDQVEKMWPWFEKGYDVVFGSRDVKGAVLDPPQPWLRKAVLGQGFKLLRKMIIGLWGIEDTQCGFKGFTERAVKEIFPRGKIDGWAFDPEILVLAKKKGYKIKEIPVTWINDPDSKVKLKGMVNMLFELLKIKKNFMLGKYA